MSNFIAEMQILIRKNKQLQYKNKRLKDRERLLDALEAAGVDNWDGYDYAMEILENRRTGKN